MSWFVSAAHKHDTQPADVRHDKIWEDGELHETRKNKGVRLTLNSLAAFGIPSCYYRSGNWKRRRSHQRRHDGIFWLYLGLCTNDTGNVYMSVGLVLIVRIGMRRGNKRRVVRGSEIFTFQNLVYDLFF